jgi:predicted flap endonuclease-1-like 5' DNA nuclease
VIDWIYWRQRTQNSTAELANLRAQNNRLRADLNAGTESLTKLKADLAAATSGLAAATADRDRARAELDAQRAQTQATQDAQAAELKNTTQQLAIDPTLSASAAGVHLSDTGDHQKDVEAERLRPELADANGEIERLRAQLESRERTVAVGERARDPLIDINGIGPVYEQRLFDAGIYTFAELAAQSPARLREIVGAKSWQETDAEAWIAQARQMAQVAKGRSAL